MDNRHVSSLPDATSGAERPRDYERRQKASRHDPAGRMDEEAAPPRKSLLNTTAALLECIGEDPKREGLRNTPERHGKAWLNITRGYDQKLDDVVNDAIFKHDATDLVLVKDIEISSVCEHHLLPFTGKMHIGYIPNGQVIGLSKLARIAEMYAQRLQIQERLTAEVAKAVEKVLKPDGVVVVCECHHQCMSMRGVRQQSAATVTQCKLGQFKEPDRMALAEFHALLNGS